MISTPFHLSHHCCLNIGWQLYLIRKIQWSPLTTTPLQRPLFHTPFGGRCVGKTVFCYPLEIPLHMQTGSSPLETAATVELDGTTSLLTSVFLPAGRSSIASSNSSISVLLPLSLLLPFVVPLVLVLSLLLLLVPLPRGGAVSTVIASEVGGVSVEAQRVPSSQLACSLLVAAAAISILPSCSKQLSTVDAIDWSSASLFSEPMVSVISLCCVTSSIALLTTFTSSSLINCVSVLEVNFAFFGKGGLLAAVGGGEGLICFRFRSSEDSKSNFLTEEASLSP